MNTVMTVGEKRSITISMKKAFELFTEENKLSNFQTKNNCIKVFYDFWLDYSLKNRLTWCYDKKNGEKNYQQSVEFQLEMKEKILDLFEIELSTLPDNAPVSHKEENKSVKSSKKSIRPLRSKKKRLQKKYEKKHSIA